MLNTLLNKGSIIHNPDFSNKEDMFRWIADDAEKKNLVTSSDAFYTGLIQREEQMSTEIEKGVALPHAKITEVNKLFVYLIISDKGIKFGGFGSKVKISFLIGAPKSDQHFLDTMALIARILNKKELRLQLLETTDAQNIASIIDDFCKTTTSAGEGTSNLHGLILVLTENDKMDTAMNLGIELGIKGAQVFDTTNVSAKIALNFPFLSLFAAKNEQISAKMMIGVIEKENTASRFVAHMKNEGIDIMEPGAGILYSFPLGQVFGGIDADYM